MSLPLREVPSPVRIYRFGEFELDLDGFRLSRAGMPVPLERRPFNLLVLLVRRHGQLVSREEIVATLWPGNVIIDFDAGVNTLVRKVRQALGDAIDQPRFVQTVSGRGYRFVAPVDEAVEETPLPHRLEPEVPTIGRNRWVIGVVAVAVVLAVASLAAWLFGSGAAQSVRVAVLPFEDRTGDVELGYLAAGLTEEVAATLGQFEPQRLRVLGSATSRAVGGPVGPLPDALNDLGVDWVLRSAVQASGTRIRVTASLTRMRDKEQTWAASFDRELTDLLSLQRELSIAIAEQIRLRLSPDVETQVAQRQTENPRAYAHYLRGRDFWGRLTPAANREARRSYQLALDEDPGYALAWAGMAQALAIAPMTTDADPATVADAAREAAERAVRYGLDLAEAQYAQAYVRLFLDWDLQAAEQAARRAVQLDPNSALAHMFLGVVLSQILQDEEALTMLRRARELDPLFAQTFALSSMVATQAGDFRTGLEFARQAIAINPEFWVGYLHFGRAQVALGDMDSALEALTTARRLSGDNSKAIASHAHVLALLGRIEEARAALRALELKSNEQYVPPYAMAVIQAGLGDVDAAFAWLERALAVRDVHVLGLHRDIHLARLADDARFQALLLQCGCTATN